MPTAAMELRVRDQTLDVCVSMTGPHHVFQRGRRGHQSVELFDWKGKRWRLRFQAFEKCHQTETTHGMLDHQPDDDFGWLPSRFSQADRNGLAAARDQRQAGWRLEKAPDGVHAVFDLTRLRTFRSGKIGSFASFNVDVDGTLYLGQFHLRQEPEPRSEPTEWDRTRGPKAGLPGLGKRR